MEKKISSLDLIPTAPNQWIWRELPDGTREFLPSATIPAKDEHLWHECTDEEKTAYEAEQAAMAEARSATEATTDTEANVEPANEQAV